MSEGAESKRKSLSRIQVFGKQTPSLERPMLRHRRRQPLVPQISPCPIDSHPHLIRPFRVQYLIGNFLSGSSISHPNPAIPETYRLKHLQKLSFASRNSFL